MKFFFAFAAIAVLYITAVVGIDFQCTPIKKGPGVNCFVDPCRTTTNTCTAKGQICCADYSKGCDVTCHDCPQASGAACFVDPCSSVTCSASQVCCPDYSDCSAKCY